LLSEVARLRKRLIIHLAGWGNDWGRGFLRATATHNQDFFRDRIDQNS
jgi:hypothetical protein